MALPKVAIYTTFINISYNYNIHGGAKVGLQLVYMHNTQFVLLLLFINYCSPHEQL